MTHVSLITLAVDDIERSEAFYVSLGWRRSSASVPGTITFLAGGTVALALFGREGFAGETGAELPAAGTAAPVALACNVPDEDAVDAALAAASGAGGHVVRPARRADWGGYAGYVADPDGHLWEVAHNPFFPLEVDGRVHLPG